jgi:hypothetical protein
MGSNEIDLQAEITRVQMEIAVFRDECLPALLCETPEERARRQAWAALGGDNLDEPASLSAWHDAADRLASVLQTKEAPICREPFREFLYEPTASWLYQSGRIRWRIELFAAFDGALLWYPASKEEQQRLSASADWPTEHRIAIEARLLSLYACASPRDGLIYDCALWNALCFVLPWIADVDPRFAKLALDKETWRTLTVTNHALTDKQRYDRQRLIDWHFGRILNNALLHVLAALANNHFLEIREYLNHPNLRGGYTYHMPYYLFTVLFEKAAALRRIPE